jgi:hypothetical protein
MLVALPGNVSKRSPDGAQLLVARMERSAIRVSRTQHNLMANIATSAAPRRFDRADVDLLHPHHRIKCALCFIAAGG